MRTAFVWGCEPSKGGHPFPAYSQCISSLFSHHVALFMIYISEIKYRNRGLHQSSNPPHLVLWSSCFWVFDGRFAEDGEDVGEPSVGNPDFASVEDVVSSFFVEFCSSADGGGVGSTRGLRQRKRSEFTAWLTRVAGREVVLSTLSIGSD